MALDRRNYRQLVETTVTVAQKTGCSQIVGRIVEDLKDESEPYRRMVMETIDKVGAACRPENHFDEKKVVAELVCRRIACSSPPIAWAQLSAAWRLVCTIKLVCIIIKQKLSLHKKDDRYIV